MDRWLARVPEAKDPKSRSNGWGHAWLTSHTQWLCSCSESVQGNTWARTIRLLYFVEKHGTNIVSDYCINKPEKTSLCPGPASVACCCLLRSDPSPSIAGVTVSCATTLPPHRSTPFVCFDTISYTALKRDGAFSKGSSITHQVRWSVEYIISSRLVV
jgi:hypothetical protein